MRTLNPAMYLSYLIFHGLFIIVDKLSRARTTPLNEKERVIYHLTSLRRESGRVANARDDFESTVNVLSNPWKTGGGDEARGYEVNALLLSPENSCTI